MGNCASRSAASVGAEPSQNGPRPIHVRPAGAADPKHMGTNVQLASITDGAASSFLDPGAAGGPSSPTPLASVAHPFGLPLTPPELHALWPKHVPPRKLSSQEAALWSQQILPDPLDYRRREPQAWDRCIADQRIPVQHRLQLWTTALRIDDLQTPLSYSAYLLQASPADSQITRDIYRTFSSHPFFTHRAVQRCVGRILHAWSLYSPVVSYVQGHNYLAALFLMVTLDEELAWRCFLSFLAHPIHGMQAYYGDSLHLLVHQCRYLEAMVASRTPRLSQHMRAHHIDALMWATPFYLTAFTHHLPLEACVFVFDFLLLADLSHVHLPAVPPPSSPSSEVSLSASSISLAITHLTLALLVDQEAALLAYRQMEKIFRTVQQLEVLQTEKNRRRVFERAMDMQKR